LSLSPRLPLLFQSRQPAPAETNRRSEQRSTAQAGFDRAPLRVKRT
jgi:hypothetical protein